MILLVDNHDSFTFNVYQALAATGREVRVVRNDVPVEELLALGARAVVLSPGPGRPDEAGSSPALLARLAPEVPLLGVCLGHQMLVEAEGGSVVRDPAPVHGRASRVLHDGDALFDGLPNPFEAGRYHSLRAAEPLPPRLRRIAWTEDGIVMGVRHVALPRWGVQFHPESILSPDGARVLENFARLVPRA
ncbi:MAG: aminodeoxychorismate/anthranilate synthase component II [Myxococcales bacterium]|nr:aminodeoxychorismate/anthranilate synthase component II [Myxococcales bacterium]